MRTVPAALQAHLGSGATTVCVLVRIVPVAPGYDTLGVTSLDRDVVYDDGAGELRYLAAIGYESSNLTSSNDMGVDNAEASALLPEFDLPLSEADIVAGALDYARWTSYLVNYESLAMGHVVLGAGELGQVRTIDGLRFIFEPLGLTQRLRQNIVKKDSLRCRATFGSMPIGTPGATVTERHPCGKETTPMWVNGSVPSVGDDPHYTFGTDLVATEGVYQPAMLEWLTGANAGRSYEVELQPVGSLTLMFPTMFPVQPGDTFRIRRDCTHWKEGINGCQAHHGAEWVLHYCGEPFIPVGDQDRINTPGAN